MGAAKRAILKPGQSLTLYRQDGGAAWTVTGFVGEGGSCVCYGAKSGMKTGRLKEFYPLDDLGAPLCRRDREGNLRFTCPAPRAQALREEFLQGYRLLEQVKEQEPGARALNNFIPPYELLRSRDGEALYIWTPDDKEGISFQTHLNHIWEDPTASPERKLYHLLSILITLTDCILLLHRVGLCHQDIRPANFLVLFDNRGEPAGISLFDINTLRRTGDDTQLAGTPGYCAPEILSGQGDIRSDIFSIGAVLLQAVANTRLRNDCSVQPDALVAQSPLILASEANSNVFLRHQLGTILRRTLSPRPEGRYSCCEALIADLRRARAFLIPEVENEHLAPGKRLALLDAQTPGIQSSTAVLRDLLFRHPLDTSGRKDISVLVVGAGTYGQKFIDICLQAGQMLDKQLTIRALSRDPGLDREVYLRIRPELHRFVDLEGGREDCYARLDFDPEPVIFSMDDRAGNRQCALDLLKKHPAQLPGWVFVSLGDDALSGRVAALFARLLPGAQVHFVLQSREKVPCGRANPVSIGTPLTARTIHPALEQMAFNAHLCWMNDPNADLTLAKKQFRRRYNLEASLAYALSVKSKLRSLGITEEDPREAAAQFRARLDDRTLERLTDLEHRRWVMDKITAGWQGPGEADMTQILLDGICRGRMKDPASRTHPCIVPGSTQRGLRRYSRQQWDAANPMDDTLDPLDRVSVQQHRLCLAETVRLRDRQILRSGDLPLLGQALAGEPEPVRRAFGSYRRCLEQILLGSRADALEFDSREAALKKALSTSLREHLIPRLDRLRRDFFPAVEGCLYRDYKHSDEALICQIPFVLTNRPGGTLLAELGSDPIANAAPVMVLRPGRVIYRCSGGDPAPMAERLLRVFGLRGLRCRVELWVPEVTPELTQLQSRWPKLVCRRIPGAEALQKALGSAKIDLIHSTGQENRPDKLQMKYPSFRFDPGTGAFTDCRGCEELHYLPGGACLRPEELDVLLGTCCSAAPTPEYGPEEMGLWARYRRDPHWQSLCRKTEENARRRDTLWTLTERSEVREISMLFPAHRYELLTILLQLLQDCGGAEPGSALEADTSDACRLRLLTRCGGVEALLKKLHRVENPQSLQLRGQDICWDDLQAGPMDVTQGEYAILQRLETEGLVQNLTADGSFRFTAPRFKALLTQPRQLARLEQWHRTRQEETFDSILWQEEGLLLIRGFRTDLIRWEEE